MPIMLCLFLEEFQKEYGNQSRPYLYLNGTLAYRKIFLNSISYIAFRADNKERAVSRLIQSSSFRISCITDKSNSSTVSGFLRSPRNTVMIADVTNSVTTIYKGRGFVDTDNSAPCPQ